MSPDGEWHGAPEDNPNIQHHSWGFGGVAQGSEPEASGEATDYAAEILRLPLAERPICPYEQTEYNTAVTDALQRVSPERTSAYGRHVAYMLALAQVMVSRAGLALREAQLTESVEVRSDNYNMTTTKVTAALAAYEKLERAWRRLLADFERRHNPWGNRKADAKYEQRIQNDFKLDPGPGEEVGADTADATPTADSSAESAPQISLGQRPRTHDTHHSPSPEGAQQSTIHPSPHHDNRNTSPRQMGGPSSALATADLSAYAATPTAANSSAESALHTSLGQRPRTHDTHHSPSPEGAQQSTIHPSPHHDNRNTSPRQMGGPSSALATANYSSRLRSWAMRWRWITPRASPAPLRPCAKSYGV